jgi:hypothetical protein
VTYVHGIFNATKCATYLRDIGVEVTEEMLACWVDAEKAHRFLRSMKRAVADGGDWWCTKGHQTYVERRRRSRRQQEMRCRCGAPLVYCRTRWIELRDGSVRDYRPVAEQWKPRDWIPPFEEAATEGGETDG